MRSPVFVFQCLSFAALLSMGAVSARAQPRAGSGPAQAAAEPARITPSAKAPPSAPRSKGKQASPLDELAALLASQDADELRLGIESAGSSRKPGAAALLAARVREGLPADLIIPAIDALSALGDAAAAAEVLAELSAHRRPAVRARALLAVTLLRTANAEGLLVRGLSDLEESVRRSAVDGLGEIGSKQALAPLFRALERGVDGAAAALGKLSEASTVPRITAYFGRMSFHSLAPLLDALLLRRSFAEETKLSLIETIARQGSAEARAYLESLSAELPPETAARVRKSITDALIRMPK
jgi:HEAT repeat protein